MFSNTPKRAKGFRTHLQNKRRGLSLLGMLLLALVLAFAGVCEKPIWAAETPTRCFGIDVSNHNGTIDWAKAKEAGVTFAIIRIGWGDDIDYQDDSMAHKNMQQCEKYGIPYGVYIYSYALSTAEVDSEIAHTARMIKGYNPTLGIWFDMEDADDYKIRHNFNPYTHGEELNDFCLRFLRGMKNKGYSKVGVYANKDYFTNVLDYDSIAAEGMIWLAHWGISEPSLPCAMWQYSDSGRISGHNGYFDTNWIFNDSPLFSVIVPMEQEQEEPEVPEVPLDPAASYYGDINGDQTIDVLDLAGIQKHILNKKVLTGNAFTTADINQDGVVDVIDLAKVQKHILGKIDLLAEPMEPAEPNLIQ